MRSADIMAAALCDDLSGAAEAALALGADTVDLVRSAQDWDTQVLDLDIRQADPETARAAVRASLSDRGQVFLKIDSLLRGNVEAMVRGVRDVRTGLVVCTPALPVAGRSTVNGRVVLPVEPGPGEHRPASVEDALGELPVTPVKLDELRSPELPEVLAQIARTGRIAVCDAETDADLDLLAAATARVEDAVAVGSAGLAAAFGRARPARTAQASAAEAAQVLVVVGSAEPSARAQVELLAADGVPVLSVDPVTLDVPDLALTHGRTVLTVRPAPLDPAHSRALAAHLARLVADVVTSHDGPLRVALTGGETARRGLDALGVRRLHLLGQVHPGAVHARTDTGLEIVTRPGSHGGPDSLLAIAAQLHQPDLQEDL
ncbi:four-carbon acid sugar kinase family protein [Prauserella cavernicola]|uniref:Four-carbon acid sugar kinase family protein n=1 Tax=Prauserella cavernicola TaxID=2800127 RepID=A0A934QTW8_9PSEU|nr:four-carbon acid sugar kinase family protein [Prauserella cavernicola]MBK1786345.1 four-carbon acid sugar kinase family protein [Prauserella cavernicola]